MKGARKKVPRANSMDMESSRANPEQMDSFATTNLQLKQIDRAFSVNQCEAEMP